MPPLLFTSSLKAPNGQSPVYDKIGTIPLYLYMPLIAVLNTTDISNESEWNEHRRVTAVAVHPNYDPTISVIKGYDIALLYLANYSEQPPMALYSGKPKAGTKATAVGWGHTVFRGQGSDILQEVDAPIVSNEVCNQPESYNGQIIDSQLCAGFAKGGKDACNGDSGGPLMALQDGKYKQVGIVSGGNGGCAEPNKYTYYTRVSSFRTWIEAQTGLLDDSESNLH